MALYRKGTQYWVIERRGSGVFSCSGGAGSTGHPTYKLCDGEREARREVERRIVTKTGAGYERVDIDFEFGQPFPGSRPGSRDLAPGMALERLRLLESREVGHALEDVVRSFCSVWKPRLQAVARYWFFEFDVDGWRAEPTTIRARFAVQYAPLGGPDWLDEHQQLGIETVVQADGLTDSDLGPATDDLSEGPEEALWTMLEGGPFDALRKNAIIEISAYHDEGHG